MALTPSVPCVQAYLPIPDGSVPPSLHVDCAPSFSPSPNSPSRHLSSSTVISIFATYHRRSTLCLCTRIHFFRLPSCVCRAIPPSSSFFNLVLRRLKRPDVYDFRCLCTPSTYHRLRRLKVHWRALVQSESRDCPAQARFPNPWNPSSPTCSASEAVDVCAIERARGEEEVASV